MKKYVVSDLHGCGEVYDSVMTYLEHVSEKETVILYINGDLIDRGPDSMRMLQDVRYRAALNSNLKVEYLGGNHEWLMYYSCEEYNPKNAMDFSDNWELNGGWDLKYSLEELSDSERLAYYNYVGNLDLYKVLEETMNGKPIVISHAALPKNVEKDCHLKVSSDSKEVEKILWEREDLGTTNYFLINGHTPVDNSYGFCYHSTENYLNIDGGCACYAKGYLEYNRVPLVEISNECLKILVFNHTKELVDGYIFNGRFKKMKEEEFEEHRNLYYGYQPETKKLNRFWCF